MRTLVANRHGGVSLIVAVAGAVLLGCAAVAIDLGSVYLHSRRLQGVADLAALAAAADIPKAQAAAEATVASNGLHGPTEVRLELGSYSADPAVAAERRFTPGGASPSAARVTLVRQAPLTFGSMLLGQPSVEISRSGSAAQTQLASLSIGSRLVSVDGGLANALLGGLTGSRISLSVMDYRALASAQVDLLSYLPALATRLNLQAATFDQVLQHQVDAPEALNALADVLAADGKTSEAGSVRAIARASGGVGRIRMAQLLDLGVYATQDRAARSSKAKIAVSALDMTRAVLVTGQEGRQLSLDLSASLPGLAGVSAWLAIGERPNNSPWLTVARDRTVILRTAQMRLFVEGSVSALNLGGSALVRLPVLVELAEGRARLDALSCSPDQVTVMASPGIGRLAIGDIDRGKLNNFRSELAIDPARVLSLPLIKVNAEALVRVGGDSWSLLTFDGTDIRTGAIKTAATRDAASGTVASLLGNTDLTVQLVGVPLGLTSSVVRERVAESLATAAAPLDVAINGISDLLGVGLGELDVRVNGLRCRDPALVA